MSNRIKLCLTTLRSRVNKHKLIEIQREEGKLIEVTCSFNPPALKSEIESFFKLNKWQVPSDYFSFLNLHNGAILFTEPKYGGGLELFSLNAIVECRDEYDYMLPPTCYPIGMLNNAILYINSEKVKSSLEGYLYWQDCIGDHETAIALNINFETFLDLFILAQGSEFWLWPTFKP